MPFVLPLPAGRAVLCYRATDALDSFHVFWRRAESAVKPAIDHEVG